MPNLIIPTDRPHIPAPDGHVGPCKATAVPQSMGHFGRAVGRVKRFRSLSASLNRAQARILASDTSAWAEATLERAGRKTRAGKVAYRWHSQGARRIYQRGVSINTHAKRPFCGFAEAAWRHRPARSGARDQRTDPTPIKYPAALKRDRPSVKESPRDYQIVQGNLLAQMKTSGAPTTPLKTHVKWQVQLARKSKGSDIGETAQ